MSSQIAPSDPYEAVIADLRSKRDQIDQTIALLTAMRGTSASPSGVSGIPNVASGGPIGGGEFSGMSIVDGTKKLLDQQNRYMGNAEIAEALQAGGMLLTSGQPPNVVGSVLSRRAQQVGDVVKVARGTWALKEWVKAPVEPTSQSTLSGAYTLHVNDLSSTGEPLEDADDDL